ncbi:hypothetical protein COLO4_03995 [Corchorus olitorius]|uniref:Uncharacterized protein n=1 Tax=Corchorus olitorius TaxID=93759 RepID=A0A1R3KVS6_9ROSI|nr:hypothetical protein COLO4_03995 [Corchorus olitorius]
MAGKCKQTANGPEEAFKNVIGLTKGFSPSMSKCRGSFPGQDGAPNGNWDFHSLLEE